MIPTKSKELTTTTPKTEIALIQGTCTTTTQMMCLFCADDVTEKIASAPKAEKNGVEKRVRSVKLP